MASSDPSVEQGAGTSPADASAAQPSATCAAIVCEDFEQPLGEGATDDGGASLAQDCERSRTGSCSLRAEVQQGGGSAALGREVADTASIHLRAYLYVPAQLELTDIALFHLGAMGSNVGLNLDIRSGDRFEVFLAEPEEAILSPIDSLGRDRWMCLQLDVDLHDTEGSVALSVDGVRVLGDSNVDTRPPSGLELFTIGVDWSSDGQAPGSVWLDSVVLDDSPVACL